MVNDSENDVDDQNEAGGGEIDDEEDWIKFQEEAKKDNLLETKSKETFPVHCPYYPGVCMHVRLSKRLLLLRLQRKYIRIIFVIGPGRN